MLTDRYFQEACHDGHCPKPCAHLQLNLVRFIRFLQAVRGGTLLVHLWVPVPGVREDFISVLDE